MRHPAAVASILVIGLVAAACGGDDATTQPAEETTAVPTATETAEETGAPAEEATEAAVAATEFTKKAQHSSSDDPDATFGLVSGRYRMEWRTTDCEQVDILVSQVGGDFSYPKPSKSSYATATINDLPEGTYKIEQLDPACADWSIRLDWMTN
jgi:hypothetical protein